MRCHNYGGILWQNFSHFLNTFNSLYKRLQFITEYGKNRNISFLNLLLKIENNLIIVDWLKIGLISLLLCINTSEYLYTFENYCQMEIFLRKNYIWLYLNQLTNNYLLIQQKANGKEINLARFTFEKKRSKKI